MPEAAQQEIRELFNSTVHDRRLVYDFNLFDSSVNQKLWSTHRCCKNLVNLDINQFLEWPPADDTGSSVSTIIPSTPLNVQDYCRFLNYYLDGFFMNAMSTLDTLAHEIFILYDCPEMPPDIYIQTAEKKLTKFHPTSKTGKLLNEQLRQNWFTEFKPFRHCTTHESLIPIDNIIYSFDNVTSRYKLLRKIKLPDNPQSRPLTYNKRRVAIEYCPSILKKVNRLVIKVYESVLADIRRSGNVLPIPIP